LKGLAASRLFANYLTTSLKLDLNETRAKPPVSANRGSVVVSTTPFRSTSGTKTGNASLWLFAAIRVCVPLNIDSPTSAGDRQRGNQEERCVQFHIALILHAEVCNGGPKSRQERLGCSWRLFFDAPPSSGDSSGS